MRHRCVSPGRCHLELKSNAMSELISAKTAGDFIKLWLDQEKRSNRRFSFEAFSRKAGFASRSFVRQVLLGQKPLTVKSFPKFVKAMGLDKNHEKLLRLHLEAGHSEFNVAGKSLEEIKLEIQNVREKIQIKKTRKISQSQISTQKIRELSTLLPFLSRATGQTIEQISFRSGIPINELKNFTASGIKNGMVLEKDGFFFASERLIQLQETSRTILLKNHVNSGLNLMRDELNGSENISEEALFLRAQYSIEKDKMLEFKNRLRSLLVEFAEGTESDNGEKSVNLICGFF